MECLIRHVSHLVEECERLDGDVEADEVDQLVHGLHLLVQLLGLQHRVGEGSVDAGQESFHQLGVNLALLHGGGEEGEVDLDKFGGQAANNIIIDMDGKSTRRCVNR